MDWRIKRLSPRLRELLKEDIERAELLLELVRIIDELSVQPKAPPPPVRVVTWFEAANPYTRYWDSPTPS